VIPAAFDYEVAESVDHALSLLAADGDAKLLAGGHSLIPAMKLRISRPSKLVDVGRILRTFAMQGRRWQSVP
jgi:carbon-monoxide dehydrogenase medium subunit